jgi:hypothetical protein
MYCYLCRNQCEKMLKYVVITFCSENNSQKSFRNETLHVQCTIHLRPSLNPRPSSYTNTRTRTYSSVISLLHIRVVHNLCPLLNFIITYVTSSRPIFTDRNNFIICATRHWRFSAERVVTLSGPKWEKLTTEWRKPYWEKLHIALFTKYYLHWSKKSGEAWHVARMTEMGKDVTRLLV